MKNSATDFQVNKNKNQLKNYYTLLNNSRYWQKIFSYNKPSGMEYGREFRNKTVPARKGTGSS